MSELILFRDGKEEPMPRPAGAYLYQYLHVHDGEVLHLEHHLQLLSNASRKLFQREFRPDSTLLTEQIAELLRKNRYPRKGSRSYGSNSPPQGASGSFRPASRSTTDTVSAPCTPRRRCCNTTIRCPNTPPRLERRPRSWFCNLPVRRDLRPSSAATGTNWSAR